MRKVGHGAGAALLLLSGAGAPGGADAATLPTPSVVEYSSLDGLTSSFLSGAFNNPLQIAGAVLLFAAAGQCIARFVGLIAIMIAFCLYSQGATLADVFSFGGSLVHRSSAAVAAFSNLPV
jgi:hypothetical protein